MIDAATPASATFRFRRLDLSADGADSAGEIRALVRRGAVPDDRVRVAARAIVDDVRARGEDAVREASGRFGGGLPDGTLLLRRGTLEAAADALAPDVRRALEQSIANVRAFAVAQSPASTITTIAPGIEIERRWRPLRRVGCYVPGGSAPYPSSLVMTVVPALVAGVAEILVASPAAPDGTLDPVLLGAAGLLGVDAILAAGGAQAVAALAFGLPSVGLEPVDRIVGPGNAWVTAAKLEVSGLVAIDLPAGPSEGLVLADATADPALVAADLLTQAEHGPDSPAILVTTDAALDRIGDGRIVLAPDLDAAIEFANAYAPEHCSIEVADADAVAARIESAGSIFVGAWAPESAGDYATGANHVLPTGGLARSCGPLSVESYGRFSQVQRIDREGLTAIRETVSTLASAEGLTAHRHAVEARFVDREGRP